MVPVMPEGDPTTSAPHRHHAVVTKALAGMVVAIALAGGVSALRDSGASEAPSQPVAFQPSVRSGSTTTTTTTVSPAVVDVSLPTPQAPPQNAYADEPHIVLGRIEIPKIGLDAPLNQGISLRSIDRGPSHWPGTALPGQPGNVVVAGHRVSKTKPFRNIDQLVPGDEVIFTVDAQRSVYVVTGSQVVTPDAMEIVNQTPDTTATLFACHPPGSARYRYVVFLKLAADRAPTEPDTSSG